PRRTGQCTSPTATLILHLYPLRILIASLIFSPSLVAYPKLSTPASNGCSWSKQATQEVPSYGCCWDTEGTSGPFRHITWTTQDVA
ncbi:hypothetical protein B0O80DRAFT_436707, partial [Mortierella sp. GBAus27b]